VCGGGGGATALADAHSMPSVRSKLVGVYLGGEACWQWARLPTNGTLAGHIGGATTPFLRQCWSHGGVNEPRMAYMWIRDRGLSGESPLVMQADASTEPGRCNGAVARVRIAP